MKTKAQRKNIFLYQKLPISKSCLTLMMQSRIYNPLYLSGPLSFKGKLIKRSIIVKNKINFEEQLRYLEDEIFMWDVLALLKRPITSENSYINIIASICKYNSSKV